MTLEEIKIKINDLFISNKEIHVSVDVGRKKVRSAVSKITGIYENFFCVESIVNSYNERFTINYRDILIKKTIINEIEL